MSFDAVLMKWYKCTVMNQQRATFTKHMTNLLGSVILYARNTYAIEA